MVGGLGFQGFRVWGLGFRACVRMEDKKAVMVTRDSHRLANEGRVGIARCRPGLAPPVVAPGHLFSTSCGPPF